jgi:hypothetical protein
MLALVEAKQIYVWMLALVEAKQIYACAGRGETDLCLRW